jgi:ribosomal protein S18 acetylase RimI-like enzyme
LTCDIGNSGELHKLYQEYCKDVGKRLPLPDIWLYNFTRPNFFCLLAKHGKKPVGFVLGEIEPFYNDKSATVNVVFVRRGFRKMKFVRALMSDAKEYLRKSNVGLVAFNRVKAREKKLNG